MTETNKILEVNRTDFGATRLVDEDLPDLAAGDVRLRIDRFALTANNITYAVVGDMLGYWDFFPAEAGWGRVPAMGWADVVESANPDIEVGGRYYGWFPMARYTTLTAGVTADGIRDDGAHRQAHAPVYRSYVDTRNDPWYEAGEDAEDRHALLRGLFLTAFLADEFFADSNYFGAARALVLSASSKTAIGFAQRASERGLGEVVGITSARNAAFVESLPWYDRVVTYDDIASIPNDGTAVSIDMAGDSAALAAVHARLGDQLEYSMIVGKSHHDAPPVAVEGGPSPEFFFAPTEVSRRSAEWGPEDYRKKTTAALQSFVAASHDWLTTEHRAGPVAAEATYHELYDGQIAPSQGLIVSLH